MSWPSYPQLTAAAADWLGNLPSHWRLDRFRYVFRESDERNGHRIVGDMLAISGYRGVEVKQYESDELKRSEEDLAKYRVVRVGQLAVNTMWLNYCGLGVSKVEGHMSPDYKAYWIRAGFNHDYLNYLLRSDAYVAGYTKYLTGVRPNSLRIDRDSLMSLPIVAPPIKEQQQIAQFLDQETGKTDALIAKQKQLIATLREDRTATITHAVTEGLDPQVPMRHSGVEWVYQFPSHWVTVPIKNRFHITVGKMLNSSNQTDGADLRPYLRAANIQPAGLDIEEVAYMPLTEREQKLLSLKAGDLVVVEGGGGYGRSVCLRKISTGGAFRTMFYVFAPRIPLKTDFLTT